MTKTQPTTDNGQRTTHKSDWRLYAAAAGAALAFTTRADASIIYSGLLDQQKGLGDNFMIGGHEAYFQGFAGTTSGVDLGQVRIGVNSAGVFRDVYGNAVNFNAGSGIGGFSGGMGGYLRRVILSSGQKFANGNFVTGNSGFVGFKFSAGTDNRGAGWIRLKVETDANGRPDGAEVIDWAYNNAGGGITAGQGVTVPEPSALGLLALGSAGVLAWRRRRGGNAER